MDARELAQIEQRIAEGYYEADADALRAMRMLVAAVRRLRQEADSAEASDPAASQRLS
jgi:hypothetical protein